MKMVNKLVAVLMLAVVPNVYGMWGRPQPTFKSRQQSMKEIATKQLESIFEKMHKDCKKFATSEIGSLIAEGADVNAIFIDRLTPLMVVIDGIGSNQVEIVKLLIAAGADLNTKVRIDGDQYDTALSMAVREHDRLLNRISGISKEAIARKEEIIRLLLNAGADMAEPLMLLYIEDGKHLIDVALEPTEQQLRQAKDSVYEFILSMKKTGRSSKDTTKIIACDLLAKNKEEIRRKNKDRVLAAIEEVGKKGHSRYEVLRNYVLNK